MEIQVGSTWFDALPIFIFRDMFNSYLRKKKSLRKFAFVGDYMEFIYSKLLLVIPHLT